MCWQIRNQAEVQAVPARCPVLLIVQLLELSSSCVPCRQHNITSKGRNNANFVKAGSLGMPTKGATRERAIFVFGLVI